DAADPGHPANDPRYAGLDRNALPSTESLATTLDRVLPYWHDAIAPSLKAGRTVLVAAHGNSLRALYKYLNNVSREEILELNIPTGIPLLFELDEELKVVSHRYLGDPEAARGAGGAVANRRKATERQTRHRHTVHPDTAGGSRCGVRFCSSMWPGDDRAPVA